MTPDTLTPRRFTDTPRLSRSLFIGSIQLLFWLFFHPSAWRNYLHNLAPDLRPNFCLAELTWSHWRRFAIWRFLIMTQIAWPLIVGGSVTLGLWLFHLSGPNILLGVIIGIAVGAVTSFAASFAGSVIVGIAMGIAIGIVIGLAGVAAFGSTGSVLTTSLSLSADLVASAIIGLASGLAGGLAFGVAAGASQAGRSSGAGYSLPRQIGGILIGILVGSLGGRFISIINERLTLGMVIGLPFGVAVLWRTRRWVLSLLAGWLVGVAGSLTNLGPGTLTTSLLDMIAITALLGSLFTLPYVLAERIAGPWAGAMAGALGSGGGFFLFVYPNQPFGPIVLFSLAGILLGLALAWWRPIVMYPLLAGWNLLLYRLDGQRLPNGQSSLLRWHSAFWDEFQRLRLIGLDNHLLLALQYEPETGMAALDYLSGSHQRWAAQETQIELDARLLADCRTVQEIGKAHHSIAAGELAGPASSLLRSLSRISQDVDAALQQESVFNRRLTLSAVEDRVNGLLRELTRSTEEYVDRFRPIAADWRQILAEALQQLAAEAELRQEIDSPYIIGVPLTEEQEIFIGRTDISARIEQLLVDRRQPPLLLYGQRRVGKTSLLNNLGRLLPSTIVPLFVDLQGPASRASDVAGFLYNMARGMSRSAERQRDLLLPPLEREELVNDPFTRFDEWLDEVEDALGEQLALLMLDEFEVLAAALTRGKFDEEAVLGMLRHLMQHRARFKVLLSGSHTLNEFQQWASYLINVQVIHIGYLLDEETRQLVTHPVRDFALRYEAEAVQRALDLTRGHPFLVQLLCAEVVALKNEQAPALRRLATKGDVDTAVPHALQHGSFFFADIEHNQVDAVGLEVLRLMANNGEGGHTTREALVKHIPSLLQMEQALAHLQHRELIEAAGQGYRFQVELIRQWFES
ncbi:MAG: hypothetical protein KC415_14620 [Anaerolineales bacterium]|nr:hypothetical protein [Anaerolineales bacterium]